MKKKIMTYVLSILTSIAIVSLTVVILCAYCLELMENEEAGRKLLLFLANRVDEVTVGLWVFLMTREG
jgi:hypothetical protein